MRSYLPVSFPDLPVSTTMMSKHKPTQCFKHTKVGIEVNNLSRRVSCDSTSTFD